MNDGAPATPGWQFWAVAVIGLLWNSFGAYLYIMTRLGDPAMLAAAPTEMQDYIATMPVWASIGWALGIWGSFLGSVLMIVRSRRAVEAFLLSFVGALASFAAQAVAGVLEPAQPVVILAVIGFLWWFCRGAFAKGVLR
ncbi:hypothetical protein [Novosphingobium sp.]|jgi:hypothetical protein|uniref:hypothetical protein n=1 Tax=Novosphingobium sp. TaxID=1874826 RepID=UPI0022C536DA|nr:hypothetical protein [Novosphingobium sp.]MCZ8019332.1 hypothetical protein [Novosphingobium sp.]MCZ8035147.1 hypothetical protein [Novosphingobium sp.]MCZ8050461.1 hypothetical protein [Novosphingobium sp.]MCZ8058807.1 hypothetical protein [Novosphingobium sp.]MCZ8232252.1 hypothetical protein [Novosphingobium sp.]